MILANCGLSEKSCCRFATIFDTLRVAKGTRAQKILLHKVDSSTCRETYQIVDTLPASTAPAAQNAKEAVVLFNAQREISMAFAAMISELYDAFRRKVGTDEAPAEPAAEAVVLENARFHSILEKVEALSRGSDQRFDSLSQGFNVLNRRFDEIN
jgi:hypothetical protein